MSRADLLAQHSALTTAYASTARKLGWLLGQERAAKATEFARSRDTTDSQRKNTAQLQAIQVTEEVLKAQQELVALMAEMEDIRLTLAYGGEGT